MPPAKAKTRVGQFPVQFEVGDLQGTRFEQVEALVDTGAAYLWLPKEVLDRLDVAPSGSREFELADGRVIEYEMAQVMMRFQGESWAVPCIIGNTGTDALLGAVPLENFALAIDPVNQRLIPLRMLLK